jgi:hypothetical protein
VRSGIPIVALLALCLPAAQARAAATSCSTFAVIKAFDAGASTVEVAYDKGDERKYFPKPEGTPRDASKIPEVCKRSVIKDTKLAVKTTGGRMTITQVRDNFQGKMLNDTDDPQWVPNKLKELITGATQVVLIVRPGMKKTDPPGITTIYLPITAPELAEIKRLEDQAEDIE